MGCRDAINRVSTARYTVNEFNRTCAINSNIIVFVVETMCTSSLPRGLIANNTKQICENKNDFFTEQFGFI